jgi:hypothetical protein
MHCSTDNILAIWLFITCHHRHLTVANSPGGNETCHASLDGMRIMVAERPGQIRILAVIAIERQEEIRRQILSFGMIPVLVSRAAHLAPHIRAGEAYHVVLLPASLPKTEDWWAIWGELVMLSPKPVILVYAPTATFQLWSGVLEAGGYDVIVEPLTDAKLKQAFVSAAETYSSSENCEQE